MREMYKTLPWFGPNVIDIYLYPLNDETRSLIVEKEVIFHEGRHYYRANDFYYEIQSLSKKKRQHNDTTTIVYKQIEYVFIICILTHQGNFWQDEQLFRREQQYLFELKHQPTHNKMEMKFIDAKKNVIDTPVKRLVESNGFKQEGFYNEIRDFYRILPWFKEKVNDIYLCPINDNAHMLVIEQDTVLDNQGNQYYRANKLYFDVQSLSDKKWQSGPKTTLIYKQIEYQFIVGIITQHGLFQQDEEIFNAQRQYLQNWKHNIRTDEIERILQSKVDLEKYGSFFKSFIQCRLEMEGPYVQRILDVFLFHYPLGRQFIDEMCRLVIFLNPKLSIVHESVFVKRFKKMYYNPEMLPFLTEYDKLGELYNDAATPRETLEHVSKQLYEQWVETRNEWINGLLVNNSSVKMNFGRTKMVASKLKFVQLPSWKRVCKNASHLEEVPEEDVVYMQDGSDIYGFSILQLFNIIENDGGVNPYTRIPLNKHVLQRFLDTYVKPQPEVIPMDQVPAEEQVNQLVLLLEKHLSFYERLCMHCRQQKAKDSIFIETYEQDFPIINFCSSECMAAYSLEEFKALEI